MTLFPGGPQWLESVMKVAVAYALSFPTAWYREKESHAVGIRTFPIVAMASCVFVLLGAASEGADMSAATSRIIQGLITGVGFVGGGAILKDGMSVHGTATAASIWSTGALGAAVAMGRYDLAVVLALLTLLTLQGLAPIKRRLDGPLQGPKSTE